MLLSRFRGALLRSVMALGVVCLVAASAQAQVIFGYAGGSQRTDGGKVVGVTFNSYGQTIGALGFYDFGHDGLATSYQVALWDGSQNLIASTTVTPTSPLIDDFRYEPIAPVTIGTFANPQPFTIGALLPANMADIWLDNILTVLGVGYTGAGTGQYTNSLSLTYPTTFDSSAYYVVNAAAVVPEPGTLVLAAAGFTGIALAGRHRRRAAAH